MSNLEIVKVFEETIKDQTEGYDLREYLEDTLWNASAEEIYNPTIGRNDIRVECTEIRTAVVNGFKFAVSVKDSKGEMYRNREAQEFLKRG